MVGTYLALFAFGGEFPGHEVLPRLYAAHILPVPGLLAALVTAHLFLVVYLKHTQWAVPGRTNHNVIGKPFFPEYAAKSAALFFGAFGVLAVLGATVQINPVWEYGPYRADVVSTDSQPDWYVGFLEGALSLMPGAETELWGHTVAWNPLLPRVVLPTALFAVLYAYPVFERWITGDTGEHHLCDRPRNQPTRTALGVAAASGYAVLLFAGAQDVLAYVLRWRVETFTHVFRAALFVVPVVAYLATKRAVPGVAGRRLAAAAARGRHGTRATHGRRRLPGGTRPAGRREPLPARGARRAATAHRRHRGLALLPQAPRAQPAERLVPAGPRGTAADRGTATPDRRPGHRRPRTGPAGTGRRRHLTPHGRHGDRRGRGRTGRSVSRGTCGEP
ncbi:hypothetical protein AQ490_04035 [Wenjunlia vitaminophila]|uniref:Cytochrome bc1 complex cytochrome b subunit n=1 Tax=Wenjunlia vitaminophila TaxID=76728 RepID=A0A0T6LRB9_WENVI|nr:hypothetical protein AQ490_04035 [Wenjunlia vitaminophila]